MQEKPQQIGRVLPR